MFFCMLFNYTILRDTKDVLVVTAPQSGAEVIPFLKTYVNLPAALLITIVYSKLCNMHAHVQGLLHLDHPLPNVLCLFRLPHLPQP